MRWAVVILGAIVAAAGGWWAAAVLAHQDGGVAAGIATGIAGVVVAACSKWANDGPAGPRPPVRREIDIPNRQDQLAGPDVPADGGPNPAAAAQRVVGDLPMPAVAWQDRMDLLDRLRVMADHRQTVVVCAVTGQRGVGKTQLVAAYARDRVAEGWPVVVWVVANNEVNLLKGLTALAEAAKVRQPETDPNNAAHAALAWLRNQPGPCLLVYDDAQDPDLIAKWTPAVGAVRTVITTTRHDFANLGEPLDVTLFTPAEAVTYLRARTGLTDDAEAARVAEQLGWLPLALAQAGAVVGPRRRYRTYRAYLDRLATMSIADLLPRPAGHAYPHAVAEAILLALDDLAANNPAGHARAQLDRLAVLAPTGADAALLARLSDDESATAILAERSLTTTTDTERTVMHRLVQRVVCEHNRHEGRLDAILVDTANRLEATIRDTDDRWATRARLADYAQHAQHLAEPTAGAAATRRILSLRLSLLIRLQRVHDSTSAISVGEALVADCERVLGIDHPDTLTSRANLAGAYHAVGRLSEAIAMDERALADRERLLGPDHPDTLMSRNNLACSYHAVGRLDEAISLFKDNVSGYGRVLGPDHPETLTTRNNLASVYQTLGWLDKAIILYERTLADRERLLPRDHPDVLTSRNNLAGAYQAAERPDEAIPLYQRTFEDRQRVLGSDHPDTLMSQNNLAYAYTRVGRLEEAIALHERTLGQYERVFGPDHPNTLVSRSNLASAYRRMGRLDEANTLYQRTFADRQRVLGPDHPDTRTWQRYIAYVRQPAARSDEAIGTGPPAQ